MDVWLCMLHTCVHYRECECMCTCLRCLFVYVTVWIYHKKMARWYRLIHRFRRNRDSETFLSTRSTCPICFWYIMMTKRAKTGTRFPADLIHLCLYVCCEGLGLMVNPTTHAHAHTHTCTCHIHPPIHLTHTHTHTQHRVLTPTHTPHTHTYTYTWTCTYY